MSSLAAVLIHTPAFKLLIEQYFIAALSPKPIEHLPYYHLQKLLTSQSAAQAEEKIPAKRTEDTPESQYLILKNITRPIGLRLEAAAQVELLELDAEQIFPLPPWIAETNRLPFIRALAKWEHELISIMDPRRLS